MSNHPRAIVLPAVTSQTQSALDQLTAALGVDRKLLASDEDIHHAWEGLPRLIQRIPADRLDGQIAKLCIAVAAGLFDSAINYAWNAAVTELRRKVREFGVHIVPQVLGKPFDGDALDDLKDAELLSLCLSLNLITEDAHFFLDQCRDVRNNCSSAHPSTATLDAEEVLVFLARCGRYALTSETNPRGVDVARFVGALKAGKFTPVQDAMWMELLQQTHEAQREMLLGTLHGMYCDPAMTQEARLNALATSRHFAPSFTPATKSLLLNRHNDYAAQGQSDRRAASLAYFAELGLTGLLSEGERHGLISRASTRLLNAHREFNNFYNEVPFAEHLRELSSQTAVPESAQFEYVCTVVLCAVGNQYGLSWGATEDYEAMIRNFKPREVAIMLEAAANYAALSARLKAHARCKERYKELLHLLDEGSVPESHAATYKRLLADN